MTDIERVADVLAEHHAVTQSKRTQQVFCLCGFKLYDPQEFGVVVMRGGLSVLESLHVAHQAERLASAGDCGA